MTKEWLGACLLQTLLSATCLAADVKTVVDPAAVQELSQT